ncbi:LytR/AlgR family response regulator transcription factor [Clostridium aminobutyricum]|uniref:Stage 0 sporulation protein A homolog n=1 Tax=Clostridium aminobutyricum TaxID=33953 RepID=A0A939DAR8_CLOAM|nr:LytTR family DNA-binding domain-containing protein [Clostridium aminobutyricum]MBN7774377.1 response regulator transcription factor [Clostridium aminobutyricum]
MLNILVIEDDFNAMEFCCESIRTILPDCSIHQAGNAEKALTIMNQYMIDVFFIDVELPCMNGFQLAQKIRENFNYTLTSIVFVTGKQVNQLAIHKRYHHYEYVMKPFTFLSFQKSIGPLLSELNNLKMKNQTTTLSEREKYVFIKTKNFNEYLKYTDILFAETENRGIKLVTKAVTYSEIKMKLEDFILTVNSPSFCRCHKSYAVNLTNVNGLRSAGRRLWSVEFSTPANGICFVSSTFYDSVMLVLGNEKSGKEIVL